MGELLYLVIVEVAHGRGKARAKMPRPAFNLLIWRLGAKRTFGRRLKRAFGSSVS